MICTPRKCAGCGIDFLGKGRAKWCSRDCKNRALRVPRREPVERFWSKVEKTESCWLWRGTILHTGYGQFWSGSDRPSAHRYSYELLVGPIPHGLHLHHICETRACVNPDHLQCVTVKEHVGLHGAGKQTHCKNGHEFTPENTNQTAIQRVCRACQREAQRRYVSRLSNPSKEIAA